MKVYSLTIEGMTTFFGSKAGARGFNSAHEEPERIETHTFRNSHELADYLNALVIDEHRIIRVVPSAHPSTTQE